MRNTNQTIIQHIENLSNSVLQYYLEHFQEMSYDKQFHFASRIYLWNRDPELKQHLFGDLRAEFTAQENPQQALQIIVDRTKALQSHGSKNAAELRRPYFERYPLLKMYVSLLFRVTFLETVYGIDARAELLTLVSDAELADYEQRLLADDDALAILSTHAINFLYLYRRIVKRDETGFDPAQFLELGRNHYDRTQKIHLQLLIYLYTHCILGESKFYYRTPTQHRETYLAMLDEIEQLIRDHFVDVNLDNKFEYLACCRLLGVSSLLEDAIYDEAGQSISEDGTFLVDRHNNNPQITNNDLDLSEHRNVLFILANQPFVPLERDALTARK